MRYLLEYNWSVRDEWLAWCGQLPYEALAAPRTGGVGSILETLFHVVDVEYSWIAAIAGWEDEEPGYADYASLTSIRLLSDRYRMVLKPWMDAWKPEMDYREVQVPWRTGPLYAGEILRHVIVHEVHHIGQLSVWARECGIQPPSANFIERGFMERTKQKQTQHVEITSRGGKNDETDADPERTKADHQ
ncbi:DinB family protein [Paenibacillus lacisoli]|uniref:DinB family protein n=1 Tax=Paenibacillus lacisoli TaxID=3064525 RepID=UPI0031F31CB2